MENQARFQTEDFTIVTLPFVEPGVEFKSRLHFGPRLSHGWRFKNPPFDENGFPREVSADEIEVFDNSEDLIPHIISENDDDDDATKKLHAENLAKLKNEVDKIPPRTVTLWAHVGRNSPDAYIVTAVYEGQRVGDIVREDRPKAWKLISRMEAAGFLFSTTAILTMTEKRAEGPRPGRTIGVQGILKMPDLNFLKAYDPTEPGLFELDLR